MDILTEEEINALIKILEEQEKEKQENWDINNLKGEVEILLRKITDFIIKNPKRKDMVEIYSKLCEILEKLNRRIK